MVILHTDGARSYLLKVKGMKHDWVAHKKKRVMIKGRAFWLKPKFSKVWWHNVAEEGAPKKKLWVKTGTQIIDRAWGMMRKHIGTLSTGPASAMLRDKVRSFQWGYWNRGNDLWAETGAILRSEFEHDFAK